MRALWLIQRTYWRYFYTTWKGNPSSFLPPNSGWWATSPSTFNGQSKWPTPFKNRSRWQISASNVSTVRASEKSAIVTNRKLYTGFPTSYRWSAYVTSKSPKGGLKKRTFPFLGIKVKFSWKKSATRFLWEKTSSGKVVVHSFACLMVHRRSLMGSRSRTFQWGINKAHTFPLKFPKGGSKMPLRNSAAVIAS